MEAHMLSNFHINKIRTMGRIINLSLGHQQKVTNKQLQYKYLSLAQSTGVLEMPLIGAVLTLSVRTKAFPVVQPFMQRLTCVNSIKIFLYT